MTSVVDDNKLYILNVVIIDWDDTFFPTSWINNNNIKLNRDNVDKKYKIYFQELDKTISDFLNSYKQISTIYIVTNANMRWIKASLNTLPLTKQVIIDSKIEIISARDRHKENVCTTKWKLKTFETIIKNDLDYIFNITDKNIVLNVLSFGDAVYEYVALVNLHDVIGNKINNNKNINYYLKNIRFKTRPDFDTIIEEMNLVERNKMRLINEMNYIDKEVF